MRLLPLFALPLGAACGAPAHDATPSAAGPVADAEAAPTPAAPTAATPTAAPPVATPSSATGPVRRTWEQLLASGCDFARVPVWTPIEARVLRNTPYALAGLKFQDINLRLLYEQDGGWYKPTLDQPPALDATVSACVDKLKAREGELRKTMPLPAELEARMTRDHALFEVLRQWGNTPTNPYGKPHFDVDSEGTWHFWSTDPGCPAGEECGGYTIACPSETPCEPVAAG